VRKIAHSLLLAKIKLRRYDEATSAIGFARNHVRTRRQRFSLQLIEFQIGYQRFCQHKTPAGAEVCHRLVNCLVDLKEGHPFPLHFRVALHLDMATDPESCDVRRTLEFGHAHTAMQRYLHFSKKFPARLQKYHARFVTELGTYTPHFPDEERIAWEPLLEALRFRTYQADIPLASNQSPFSFMKRFMLQQLYRLNVLFWLGYFLLEESCKVGIFIIDCIDV
jgi:hypothetical protein